MKQPTPPNPENPWTNNPTGIDNAIDDLFPEPTMVTAVENIEDDVSKSRQGTTIGKLIAEIIQPIEERYGGVRLKLTSDYKEKQLQFGQDL